MPDIEKVIKGLEYCMIEQWSLCPEECPYRGQGDETEFCYEKLIKDAYALLKTSRIMTLEEVLALKPDTPIYMQHKSGEHGWDIYRGIEDVITHDIVTGSLWAQGDCWYQKEYGKSFVFWTAKPTDKQRKMVKWDE